MFLFLAYSMKYSHSSRQWWWKVAQHQSVLPGNQFSLFNPTDANKEFVADWPQFDGDTDWERQTSFCHRHQRHPLVAIIKIHDCVPDAAFKVPSTRHLTTASLYWSRPSPCLPLLKQSIIKENLSAITLSDPNGISSGTLKLTIFFCSKHGGSLWHSGWVGIKHLLWIIMSLSIILCFILIFFSSFCWL